MLADERPTIFYMRCLCLPQHSYPYRGRFVSQAHGPLPWWRANSGIGGIFHTGDPLDVAWAIRCDRCFREREHVQYVLPPQSLAAQPFPIRLSTHVAASRIFGTARPQNILQEQNLTSSSRGSHGRRDDQDREEAGTVLRQVRYRGSICQNGAT